MRLGFTLRELIVLMGLLAVVAVLVIPWGMKKKAQGDVITCESNEKNIGTALEMYSTDNCGRYPRNLSALAPEYLPVIPTCPAARRDSYSSGYQVACNPDNYSFCCSGDNHAAANLKANCPRYITWS